MSEQQAETQQQQQQHPQQRLSPARDEPAEQMAKMEIDENARLAASRRSSQSSTSSDSKGGPSIRSIHKAVKSLREDVDDIQDAQKAAQKQLLWAMAAQVRKDRQEASCQLVLQGFEPWTEAKDPVTAFRNRDKWCLELCEKLSGTPRELIRMSASHGTSADRLSRLSILTFPSASLTSAIARGAGAQRHMYGSTPVSVRRQTCVYDRLCSAPAKIIMEAVSREAPPLKNQFRPDWKLGNLWTSTGELIGIWRINIQKARIKVYVQDRFLVCCRESMLPGLERLQFGPLDHGDGGDKGGKNADPSKGKGKSKGRGKLAAKYTQPVEDGIFRHSPPQHRAALGSLQLCEYPFEVSIRPLKAEHLTEAGANGQAASQKKRQGDEEVGSVAKRSPTPERPYHGDGLQPPRMPDPWAAAQRNPSSTSPPLPSQPSQPSQPTHPAASSELSFGDRISA